MNLQRVGVSLFTLIAIVSIVLAAATIWLFVTNPVTVATAVNEGEISPLVRSPRPPAKLPPRTVRCKPICAFGKGG